MNGPPKATSEKEKAYLAKQEKRDQYAAHIFRSAADIFLLPSAENRRL